MDVAEPVGRDQGAGSAPRPGENTAPYPTQLSTVNQLSPYPFRRPFRVFLSRHTANTFLVYQRSHLMTHSYHQTTALIRISGGTGGGAGGGGGREGVVLCTQWRELATWGNALLLNMYVTREKGQW